VGSQLIPGRLEPGYGVLLRMPFHVVLLRKGPSMEEVERVHPWKECTGGINLAFCTTHTSLSGKIIAQTDLLNSSFIHTVPQV
jgi:hypothetical protein